MAIKWLGPWPKRRGDPDKGKFPFPGPALRGYEGKRCGGRHLGLQWEDTVAVPGVRPGAAYSRKCRYCGTRVAGILSPRAEGKFQRMMQGQDAAGKASKAGHRIKRTPRELRRGRGRAGGVWSLRRNNVSRDKRSGQFTPRG